jgi:replicative DNA helicase
VGKTTLLINIIHNLGELNVGPILFFTMEMPLAQVYERMAQIELALPGERVESSAKEFVDAVDECQKELGPFYSYAARVHEAYKHCYFVEEDCLRLEQLEELTNEAEIVIGQKPRLIMVDYMGRMMAYGNPYEAVSSLAKGLKYLAKKLNVAVVSLHQVGREKGKDGSEPLTIESARDSGAVEEACDFLIGMWRPEKKEKVREAAETITLALLKNRRGYEVKTELEFYKPTLRMTVGREPGEDDY